MSAVSRTRTSTSASATSRTGAGRPVRDKATGRTGKTRVERIAPAGRNRKGRVGIGIGPENGPCDSQGRSTGPSFTLITWDDGTKANVRTDSLDFL